MSASSGWWLSASSAYLFEGFGPTDASFAADYDHLLSTFTTTAASAPPTISSRIATSTPAESIGAKVVATPPGFMLAEGSGMPTGPVNAAAFNSYINSRGAAEQLHYVTGYQALYYTIQNSDSILVALFDFATSADARNFRAGFTTGSTQHNEPAIPGAQRFDATKADSTGSYDHTIITAKADTVMIIDYWSSSAEYPPLLDVVARQQYTRL